MAGVLAAGPPLILLYVEDDQITRDAVCTMVGRRFPELVIHTAGNGAEGVQRFLELGPDLVVTDIEMPVMHGIEMSRRIIALQSATPIIVTSAHRDMDYFIESIEIGISRYVMKPIDKDKLFAAIEGTLVTLRLERKLMEQREFIQKLSRAVEQSPSSIAITDLAGCIEYVNPRFTDLTGYSGQEVLGQGLRALQQGGEELWSCLDAGLEWHGELESVKKSGEPYSES
ncbi:MAG TPA: response regulator, partial [Geomonas sp.]